MNQLCLQCKIIYLLKIGHLSICTYIHLRSCTTVFMLSLTSIKSSLSEQISIREGKVYWCMALLNKPGVIRSLFTIFLATLKFGVNTHG